jgi:hypothetical protein
MLIGVNEIKANARVDTVNVLLEGLNKEGHARLASYPRGAESADDLLQSMEHVSVLLHKLVVSFLLCEASGGPVVGSLLLDWDRIDGEQG